MRCLSCELLLLYASSFFAATYFSSKGQISGMMRDQHSEPSRLFEMLVALAVKPSLFNVFCNLASPQRSSSAVR
jgi:hypothetical protein